MSALERFAVNAAEKLEPVRRIAVVGAPINVGASQRGTLMSRRRFARPVFWPYSKVSDLA